MPEQLFRSFSVAHLAILSAGLLSSAWAVFVSADLSVYQENGLLENLQALFITMAALAFLLSMFLQTEVERLINAGCILLCGIFLLREVDLERIFPGTMLATLGHGTGRALLLGSAALALAVLALRRLEYYLLALPRFLNSRAGRLLGLAGLALVAGQVFEELSGLPHNVFWEECAELMGYFFVALSGLSVWSSGWVFSVDFGRPEENCMEDNCVKERSRARL
ncbi:hypothetical protein ACXYTJ_05975 [Gilvimarinus sp. F26214L]|uniref:hypothetical protein n=1 Tax=Gilvimarinus sp. DZF01 TaxID=3461371 RepID=UPI004045DAFA